ncbi:MAG: AMP-binding protein [Hyphomicrobiaceae bacterium]
MSIDMPFGIAGRLGYAELCRSFQWNTPETFNFATDVVEAWAAQRDGTALITEGAGGDVRTFRFSDIALAARRFAEVLDNAGVAKGDRIVIMMPRIAEWQIAMVGAMRIGAVVIPCIEMLTARDVAYRIEHSGATAVFCRASQRSKFDAVRVPVRIALDDDGSRDAYERDGWIDYSRATSASTGQSAPVIVHAEDPVAMYYTSGSTGHPKGVLHAARAIFAWRYAALHWLDLSPEDRIWCTADIGWSKAGTSVLFGPWSCGACAFMFDGPFDPAVRLSLLSKHRISVYCAPATELNRVVDENISAYDISVLRRTVSAGEPMNPVVAGRWQAATGVDVCEAYGQTESLMTVFNFPDQPGRIGSMGRPGPGIDLDVVDDEGNRLGADAEGHIAVCQPNPLMMLGYWNDEEKTDASFVDGPEGRWYLSGDRGVRDSDGYFWFAGRADDVITSAGYRIGPMEVENALLEHVSVLECAVIGAPDAARGEIVKAFIVLRHGAAGDDALVSALQDHVKALTAPYKYPRAIEFLDELPKTITGKIRRRALRDREKSLNGGPRG